MKTLRPRCASITRPSRYRAVSGALAAGVLAISMLSPAARAAPAVAQPTSPHFQSAANSIGVPDIRDIRPPFHIASGWFWFAAAAGCGALGAAAGGWYWWRRRAKAANKTAAELALERLEEARALLVPGQGRAFSIAVSAIVRAYIEQRFNIAATQQTTREFLQDCLGQSSGSLAAHRQSLGDFLQYCDLAKFARWTPSIAEMEALLAGAIAFVNATVAPDSSEPIASVADRPGSVVPEPDLRAPTVSESPISDRRARSAAPQEQRAVLTTSGSQS